MIRSIRLQEIPSAVDSNSPSSTLLIDPSLNSVVFYKYKGTLVERDTLDFNDSTLRSRIKHSLTRGSTLALKLSSQDDISQFLHRDAINPDLFNRSRISKDYLDSLSSGRDDYVLLDPNFRLVVIIAEENVPQCLQRFVDSGDLVPTRIV